MKFWSGGISSVRGAFAQKVAACFVGIVKGIRKAELLQTVAEKINF